MKAAFSLNYKGNPVATTCHGESPWRLDETLVLRPKLHPFPEYDAVEWVLWFENDGSEPSGILSDIWDADVLLPLPVPPAPRAGYSPQDGNLAVDVMQGMVDGGFYIKNDRFSAREFSMHRIYLDKEPGHTCSFENITGRSSDGIMPFFHVGGDGEGYMVAIGWTGDWKIEFTGTEEGVRVRSGMKETNFYLLPGEKVRTTSVLVMKYQAGEDFQNKFRRLMKAHFSHLKHTPATREGLMAFELWGGLPSEEMKSRLRELQRYDIKMEDIWIDAGWYGQCEKCDEAFSGDWSKNTGNWEVNKRVHPGELRDVAQVAREGGMNLMLWLEPERAITGTSLVAEHPEWFLSLPGRDSHILNYGVPEAKERIYQIISGYVKDLNLSCYRQDFNTELTTYFKAADAPDRRGITEIKHILGMYDLWDRLHAEFPELLIDNCSSGGRRIDIESCKRAIPFFRSDYQCNFNENPDVLQVHNAGIARYLPMNGCTGKTKCDTYTTRSAYSTSWGAAFYNAVFQTMEEEDFAWAKKVTDDYRAIRRYFSCDFYNHGTSVLDESAWAIFQYHDADAGEGIVMAFRRSESPFATAEITLGGIPEGKEIEFFDMDSGESFVSARDIAITIPTKRTSRLLKYKVK
ncbi:MAG: alpha-galactosidase [Clostridia bacterium]|nr:alpha-galactosidase [Clostridia bacterium]